MCYTGYIVFITYLVILKFSHLSLVWGEETLLQTTVDTSIPELLEPVGCVATECSVRANITLQSESQFPVNINCASLNETDTGQRNTSYDGNLNDLFLNRFKNIQNISMDGRCSNVQSFGMEHFPDANKTLEAAIFRYFRIDVIEKETLQSISVVKDLQFENNTFVSVKFDAFEYTPLVSKITFQQNHLKYIDIGTFDVLTNLDALSLYEEELTIEADDFFGGIACEKLAVAIKNMPKQVFGKLPKPLIILQVNNMSFDEIEIHNPGNMSALMIFDNTIPNLSVIDSHKLNYVNLSHNSLESFKCINCSQVETLCLSSNNLNELHDEQFANMEQLKFVYLQRNKLKKLSMGIFRPALPTILKIDLTNNSLHSLSIAPNFTSNPDMKVVLNSNPWDCQWILSINELRPDIFRVFQYDKFISKINLNGLECKVYPSSLNASSSADIKTADTEADEAAESESADIELERAIRRHILHGLMIIAGIAAAISLVLYVWVRCRDMVRLPFYESLKRSPEQFDVVRPVSTDDRPDYEIPLEFFNSNTNLEHVELLDTIGSLEPIEAPTIDRPHSEVIYEEIPE